MNVRQNDATVADPPATLAEEICQLARTASVEIGVADVPSLERARASLRAGTRVYVSHLPHQRWQDTCDASRATRAAGFEPIPHVPVRLIADVRAFDDLLAELADRAGVREVLLIAGDYPQPAGAFANVMDALRTNLLEQHGITAVSLAGHPEGHPSVRLEIIRAAEIEKAAWAAEHGLATTLLTQFFFDAPPFIEWAMQLRAAGVHARLIAGLAGPARLATLFKLAARCGVGASIRALGARPTAIAKLLREHGPERVLHDLAVARMRRGDLYDGVHLFSFGGFLHTCEWLAAVADGWFTLTDSSFEVHV